jgi:hypothetical protein
MTFLQCASQIAQHHRWSGDPSLPIGVALYLFVLISGLILVQKPSRIAPMVIALVIQIPMIATASLSYQFVAGSSVLLGWRGEHVFGWWNIGFAVLIMRGVPPPYGYAVNLVPVVLLLVILFHWRKGRRIGKAPHSVS